jgi:hypothetical protein
MVVRLSDDTYQVIKSRYASDTLIHADEHKEILMTARNPMVLDPSYLKIGDDGLARMM